jgi:sulfur-carrier protein adenylyltransferase/sulfurtransferase
MIKKAFGTKFRINFESMALSKDDLIRYNRHLILRDFGVEKQQKLKQASVLVVGAGGLGSPVLLYLTAAGVGTIGIADDDTVDLSNLQRQILFREDQVGQLKAVAAAENLQAQNSGITFETFPFRLTAVNAGEVITPYDIVIDGTDNFPTRYLLNDACVLLNKPLIYGSILAFEGQLSVFNLFRNGSYSANYRDLFAIPPNPASIPDCSNAGVLGVLPGIIGCLQANEAIKIITGLGDPLSNRLLIIDSLTLEQTIIQYSDNQARRLIKSLIDYDEFCGIAKREKKPLAPNRNSPMKEVTVQELKEMMDSGKSFQLIDVREPHEYDICNLGGELIPQGEIPGNVDRISKDKQVVVQWLESNHGFTNLYNLKGGVLAWARDIDPDMPTY